ncbi:hypothetical protein FLONG3_1721 [Fusarium longipes]|uniref:AAA+ ATPase domain-containing protein n=1 Tax=Fusarium longipes TaxID=694270 RepID=A0A395T6Q2_9HYPO|nr:hypothetical protein FLONG3_1721 [Fusarium longipes]
MEDKGSVPWRNDQDPRRKPVKDESDAKGVKVPNTTSPVEGSSESNSSSKLDLESQSKPLQHQFADFQYQVAASTRALQHQFADFQYQVAASTRALQHQVTTSRNHASYGAAAYPTYLQQASNAVTPQAAATTALETSEPGIHHNHQWHLTPTEPRNTNLKYGNSDDGSPEDSKRDKEKRLNNPAFNRVDNVWDNKLKHYKLQETTDADTIPQYKNFIFHVRRTFDTQGRYETTFVDIKSKLLRECLQDVIGNIEGISLAEEVPNIRVNLLFLYLEDMRHHLKALQRAEPDGETQTARENNEERLEDKKKQLEVLVEYLDHDFKSTKRNLHSMLKNGLITFNLLWALWKPNMLAYTTTYGHDQEPRILKVEMAELRRGTVKGQYYYVCGKFFGFDGKRFGYGHTKTYIEEFQGARKITSLSIYPIQYHKNEVKLRRDLIERGKKFVSLSGVHYKSYQGIASQVFKKAQLVRFDIQPSRVMIDTATFRRINPNYNVSLVEPNHPDVLSAEADSSSDCKNHDCYHNTDDEEKVKHFTELDILSPKTSDGKDGTQSSGNDDEKSDPLKFTDEEYLIASPLVLGFAFAEKQWLELAVSGVDNIKWNEKAWDSLYLEDGKKNLIKALVKSRKYHAANTIDDVIRGKGKGLVTVLHGPPGTGKTLTAESISEMLRCPLYKASAGEMGTDSKYLETQLQTTLAICHTWGAILLLNEADVFIERRDLRDIHRNALVSIFLRQLEYFQGIMFLTTNRVQTFDEAFQSRIHIALRYDKLDLRAKQAIFKMFLDRVEELGKLKVEPLTKDELTEISRQDLNGREIKNVVGSAQDLAVNEDEALSIRHIRQVLAVHARFDQDLKGGAGYEDAMRNYC